MKRKLRINGHSHLLPYPEEIPQFMKDNGIFWVDKDRNFMLQKNWKRPVTDSSFFLNEKLDWMEKYQIDHAVVLNLSQLYGNGLRLEEMKKALRFQNDFNASVQNEYPEKFTCGFVVQPLYIDQALKEMERCVNELSLKVLCLPTHFLNSNGEWLSTAEKDVDPIYELANKYGLAIQIHPYDGEKMIALKNQYWRFHLIWMMAQCADTLHLFTLRDLPNKFPNLRTSFAHGGMLGIANYGRRIQGFDGRPDIFEELEDPRKTLGHKNLYFDTLVHDSHTLDLLKKRVGVSQLIMGLDDPFPLGEIEGVGTSYPGRVLDYAVETGILTQQEEKDIWNKNVLAWLNMKQEDFK